MADTPEPKPHFWSSIPGIFTGLGGLIVAVTGLITALYSTGVIGPNASPNTVPPVNTAATLVSAPTNSNSQTSDNDRYKGLAGKWEVIEQRTEESGGEEITWHFDATISGNEFALKGKMLARNGNKNLDDDDENTRAAWDLKLMDLMGSGHFKETINGVTTSYPATIRLDEESPKFHGTIEINGKLACTLKGQKRL